MQFLCETTSDVFHEKTVVISPQMFCLDFFLILSGFLLTTSPTVGFNNLDLDYKRYIDLPPNAQTARPEYSALENIRERWKAHGTDLWGMTSVHWLMVLLIIELEVAPHGDHTWRKIPDIQNAYLPIVRDLVSTNATVTLAAH